MSNINLTPEQQKVMDSLHEALQVFMRTTEPFLKEGVSAAIRIEYMGILRSASVTKQGATPEIVIMEMLMQKGAEKVLGEIMGSPVIVQAAAIPASEMEGERSFITIEDPEDEEEF